MKSPQPATTITLHFRPKVMHPVLWRTRGNVLAVAGLKGKRPKRETSESLLLHKDWSELRWERQRERERPKTAWNFCFALLFSLVGGSHLKTFRTISLLPYAYAFIIFICLHRQFLFTLLAYCKIDQFLIIEQLLFFYFIFLMGNANVSHTAFFTNNNINDCFLKKI